MTIAYPGLAAISKIKVGDVIATGVFNGWPGEVDEDGVKTLGHSAVIADIRHLQGGVPDLETEVYLLYNSSHDGKASGPIYVWTKLGDLLKRVDGNGKGRNNDHEAFYVVRSLNFQAFNTLFDKQ